MALEIRCPNCSRTLRIADEHAGKQVRCPACQQISTAVAAADLPRSSTSDTWHLQTPEGPIYGPISWRLEWAEINGSEASAVYRLHMPNQLMLGKTGQDLAPVDVPAEFLKPEGSPRDPAQGEPATVFRYDLVWEFVSAICEQRDAVPSFYDGLRAQLVADSVLQSHADRRWIDILDEPK